MNPTRRSIVIGLPVLSASLLSACGGSETDNGTSTLSSANAADTAGGHATAQAINTSTGKIQITNGSGGNFPVALSGFTKLYNLYADTATSQALINHVGSANASNLLSLSISSPATINSTPVVAALLIKLDLGASLPATATTYALNGSSVKGDALVVATQLPNGGTVNRQVFKITGGSITVQPIANNASAVKITLKSVTAVAAGGLRTPAAGSINLSTTAQMAINLVVENTSVALS